MTCRHLPKLVCVLSALLLLAGCDKRATEPGAQQQAPKDSPAPQGAPRVMLQTDKGDIVIELDDKNAPITTKNFLQYVNDGFYNATVFHRVIKDFMIQGGGFDTNLVEKQTGAPIKNEASNGLKNARGTIAMARTSDPDSATAQFFINHVDNHALNYPSNGGYTVFGKVVEGMDVIDAIANVPTTNKIATTSRGKAPFQNVPVQNVVVLSAKVVPAN